MIIKLGDPPFPAHLDSDLATAKVEHVWHAARRYAKRHSHRYTSSYGVEGVAPT
jgi:hypothetical protein